MVDRDFTGLVAVEIADHQRYRQVAEAGQMQPGGDFQFDDTVAAVAVVLAGRVQLGRAQGMEQLVVVGKHANL
ncbi:hypothetical protein D3C78_1388860 [compost metagenome]